VALDLIETRTGLDVLIVLKGHPVIEVVHDVRGTTCSGGLVSTTSTRPSAWGTPWNSPSGPSGTS